MMATSFDRLRSLAGQDKMKQFYADFKQLAANDRDILNAVVALEAAYTRLRWRVSIGTTKASDAADEFTGNTYGAIELLTEFENKVCSETRVFISYSHRDSAVANQLCLLLRGQGVRVMMDSDPGTAGRDIEEFIRQSVQECRFTLAIVSKNSLLSSWVAMEMTETFNAAARKLEKGFIGCYIDMRFLERRFVDEALPIIHSDLQELEQLKIKRTVDHLDTRDINKEYSRLRQLSHSLDDIVGKLRACICIDISGDNLTQNLPGIVQSVSL